LNKGKESATSKGTMNSNKNSKQQLLNIRPQSISMVKQTTQQKYQSVVPQQKEKKFSAPHSSYNSL
jgi:hypothetical protein